MAFYLRITKTDESEASVRYVFESGKDRIGVLSFNKLTGEASLIDPMPGDERNTHFTRAAVKVGREWKMGRMPEVLEWAS